MDKSNPTEYTAVPPAAYPPTIDTGEEEHQPAAPTHPLITLEPLSPYVDPSKPLLSNYIASYVRHAP